MTDCTQLPQQKKTLQQNLLAHYQCSVKVSADVSWQEKIGLHQFDIVLLRFQNVSCRSVSVGFAEKSLGFRFGLCFQDKRIVNFFMTRVIWHDFHHR